MTRCGATKPIKGAGFNVCGLTDGHANRHIDTYFNVSWAPSPVHLHGPVSGARCGASKGAGPYDSTAYRSDATCADCLATLR